jgi:hypothetical protein
MADVGSITMASALQQLCQNHREIQDVSLFCAKMVELMFNSYEGTLRAKSSRISSRHGEARETLQNLCIFFVEPTIQKLG